MLATKLVLAGLVYTKMLLLTKSLSGGHTKPLLGGPSRSSAVHQTALRRLPTKPLTGDSPLDRLRATPLNRLRAKPPTSDSTKPLIGDSLLDRLRAKTASERLY